MEQQELERKRKVHERVVKANSSPKLQSEIVKIFIFGDLELKTDHTVSVKEDFSPCK